MLAFCYYGQMILEIDFYQLEDIAAEIDLWFHLWKGKQVTDDKLKEEVIEIIDLLNGTDVFYPTIRQALLILSTIPRTTATVERSFSTLRRVKTWLRSTMGEARLTGICLLSGHRVLVEANRKFATVGQPVANIQKSAFTAVTLQNSNDRKYVGSKKLEIYRCFLINLNSRFWNQV
nr:unnamed protein product [Callosobruchus analis]